MFPPSLLVFPYKGCPNWSPTARNIPPSQPSARQDALFPERGPSNSFYLSLGEWPRLPSTARDILTRPTPSAPRRALLPREHSSIVRVLRARRAPGRSPSSSYTGRGAKPAGLVSDTSRIIVLPPTLARISSRRMVWLGPPLRTSNDHSFIVGGSVSTGNQPGYPPSFSGIFPHSLRSIASSIPLHFYI